MGDFERRGGGGKKVPGANFSTQNKIRALHEQGYSAEQISNMLAVYQSTVESFLPKQEDSLDDVLDEAPAPSRRKKATTKKE